MTPHCLTTSTTTTTTTTVIILLLSLPPTPVNAGVLLASHMDVFSDLLENIMYSVIKQDSDQPVSVSEVARQEGRESKARRRLIRPEVTRLIRPEVTRLPIARMKTRELERTNHNQTDTFFRSKKIVSRQRNRKIVNNTRNVSNQETKRRDKSKIRKEDVDMRLQKVKELFQLIKVSKKDKIKSQTKDRNVKSKFLNFPLTRSRMGVRREDKDGLSSPHMLDKDEEREVTVRREDRTEDRSDKLEALQKLFRIAGPAWVRTNIAR